MGDKMTRAMKVSKKSMHQYISKNPVKSKSDEPIVKTQIIRRVPAFWIYAILLILAVYTAVTVVKQETEMQTLRRATTEIQEKIEHEKYNNQLLQEQKMEILSEDSIEQMAREKLGYVKDGERVFVDVNK